MHKRCFVFGTLLLFLSFLLRCVPVTGAQVDITVNVGVQTGPSTVSNYLAVNQPMVWDVDLDNPILSLDDNPILSSAFSQAGLKHVRVYADFDFFIPVSKDGEGMTLDFAAYDKYLDGLRRLGASPLIMIHTIPNVISSKRDDPNFGTYPPVKWRDWHETVLKLVRHNVERGLSGLYYEVWNEPEGNGDWQGTYEEFITLYIETARAIKEADRSAKAGGPGTVMNEWISPGPPLNDLPFPKNFLLSIKQSSAPLDFLSWHHYNEISLAEGAEEMDGYVTEVGFPTKPEYLVTEWNVEWDSQSYSWEFKTSYLVSNIIEQVNSPTVWPFWFTFWVDPATPGYSDDFNTGLLS